MSTAAEDQGWRKDQPREESEASRLLRSKPRWCAHCNAFGDHHTDRHDPDEELAQPQAVREALLEARKRIGRT